MGSLTTLFFSLQPIYLVKVFQKSANIWWSYRCSNVRGLLFMDYPAWYAVCILYRGVRWNGGL